MRTFNVAGPCDPREHYMVPPELRLPIVRRLIDEKGYFTVHAPRQTGKTTIFRALTRALATEGHFAALLVSCESAQAAGGDVARGIGAVLDAIDQAAQIHLPLELRPPPVDAAIGPENRLFDLLRRWCQACPRPVVLFLDEIDALLDAVMIAVLRQLRAGFPERPDHFPWSVALIGLRDVRDYRLTGEHSSTLGTSSPFNVKIESVTIPFFAADEVAALCTQHEAETGQLFSAEAKSRIFAATAGQPWLVNAVARLAVGAASGETVELADVLRAQEMLIERRDTHLDSLLDRLREPRVRRVIAPILAGEHLSREVLDDDLLYVEDLGLIKNGTSGLEIANPIYQEIIPRALTATLQRDLVLPRPSYLDHEGGLLFDFLLEDFGAFWLRHAESFLERAPYAEAAAQLVFMAFLQRVVNGGGMIEREYAVGSGRLDLCVRWPRGKTRLFAIEIKTWRSGRPDPQAEGLEQLAGYLERLDLKQGTLLIFDQRREAPPLPERQRREVVENRGARVEVWRL